MNNQSSFVSILFAYQLQTNSKTNNQFVTMYFENGTKLNVNVIGLVYIVLRSMNENLTGKTLDNITDADLSNVEKFLANMVGKNCFIEMKENEETGYNDVVKFVVQQTVQSGLLANGFKSFTAKKAEKEKEISQKINEINSISTMEELKKFERANRQFFAVSAILNAFETKENELNN